MFKKISLCVVAFAVTAPALFAAGTFSASSVPGVGIKKAGKVSIRNDARSITVWQFDGNIERALLSLKSTRSLRSRPFGPALYNSNANVPPVVPAYLSDIFRDAAKQHGVDPRLLTAVAARESAFDPGSVSNKGAQGIMQLMPATSRFLGIANPFDARENVFAGARYLRMLLDTFKGDLDLSLAAYNAGPGAVQKFGGVPPYRETMDYVRIIRASYEAALK